MDNQLTIRGGPEEGSGNSLYSFHVCLTVTVSLDNLPSTMPPVNFSAAMTD